MSKIKWNIDPAHSEVTFKVKHMMITNVTGTFREFSADVETEDDDFTKASLKFTAKAASVDTGNEQRDAHLKSAEFFDADQHPEIVFTGKSLTKFGGENYKLQGDLTMRGVTKSVTLDAEFGGIQKDPWGNTKAGFTVTGKINRKEWGLNWNAALEAGGVMVSDEVRINCEIQLVKVA